MTDMTQRAIRDEALPTLERLNEEAKAIVASAEEERPLDRINRLAAELSHALNDYPSDCHAVVYPSKKTEFSVGIILDGLGRTPNPAVTTGRGSYRRFEETTLADILRSYDACPPKFRDETRDEVIAHWRLAEAKVNALRAEKGFELKPPETVDVDPIIAAITAYRDGNAAFEAIREADWAQYGGEDGVIEKTYGPAMAVLDNWKAPASTRDGAVAALRLAVSEAQGFACCSPAVEAMLTAALAYFEGETLQA